MDAATKRSQRSVPDSSINIVFSEFQNDMETPRCLPSYALIGNPGLSALQRHCL